MLMQILVTLPPKPVVIKYSHSCAILFWDISTQGNKLFENRYNNLKLYEKPKLLKNYSSSTVKDSLLSFALLKNSPRAL